MTTGCVTVTSYTSGAQSHGLIAGTSYFAQIIAIPPAGFVSATSAVVGDVGARDHPARDAR